MMQFSLPVLSLSNKVLFQAVGKERYEAIIRLYAKQILINRLGGKNTRADDESKIIRSVIDKKITDEMIALIEEKFNE